MDTSTYQDLPLEKGTHEIRLITLLESDNDSNSIAKCKMFKADLDKSPVYTALSYVWGSKANPISVSVNGDLIEVTENLGTALKNIRAVWGEITLWVDAICVNQNDLEERAGQIPMMGRIFGDAQRTIGWVSDGPENERYFAYSLLILGQKLPPDVTLKLAQEVHKGMSASQRDDSPPNFDAATQRAVARLGLAQSQYWLRTWIVQEIMLARNLIIQSGCVLLPWSVLSAGLLQSGSHRFHEVSNVDGVLFITRVPEKIHGLAQAKEVWHTDQNSPRDLLSVMNTHLAKMATDQRDKIWGFLGVSDDGNSLTKVVLTEPVEKIYLSFAQEFIKEYKSLRIIQSAGIGLSKAWRPEGESLPLPSWVPQWYFVDPPNSPDRVVLDVDGKSFHASKDRAANVTFAPCGTILRAQGMIFDTIASIKIKDDNKKGQLPTEQYLEWFLDTATAISGSNDYVNGQKLLKVYFRAVLLDQFPNSHSRLGSGSAEFIKLLLLFMTALKELSIFSRQIVSGDDGMGGEMLSMVRAKDEQKFVIWENDDIDVGFSLLRSNPNEIDLGSPLMTWVTSIELSNILDRVLFLTSKGYLGVGPSGLLSSDIICVILGCSVPVLLRKVEDHFVLVGECYVHGLMDGEAIDFLEGGNMPLQMFEIH